ncbi:hypothetical protein LSAT2_003353 [Lamellibrachia satsuma]|nr:hypothetical protein LSAT2_003353 [Lamellibrachia satsuma]
MRREWPSGRQGQDVAPPDALAQVLERLVAQREMFTEAFSLQQHVITALLAQQKQLLTLINPATFTSHTHREHPNQAPIRTVGEDSHMARDRPCGGGDGGRSEGRICYKRSEASDSHRPPPSQGERICVHNHAVNECNAVVYKVVSRQGSHLEYVVEPADGFGEQRTVDQAEIRSAVHTDCSWYQLTTLLMHEGVFQKHTSKPMEYLKYQQMRMGYDIDETASHLKLLGYIFHEQYQHLYINLEPYVNQSAVCVQDKFSLHRAYMISTTLGLRHLTVVNHKNEVVGIITRKDLMAFNLEKKLTQKIMQDAE